MFGKKKEQARRRVTQGGVPPASSVYSYYNNKQSPAADKTVDLGSAGHRLRLLPTVVALSVIGLSILYSLTLTPRPSVSTLGEQASPYRSADMYADAAAEIMNSKLSNKSKLSIDTNIVEEEMLKRFPELKAAVLRLPILGRRPNMILDIKPPAILLNTTARSYVLDSSGIVISEMQDLSEEARRGLLIVKDQSNLPVEIGKQAVTSDTVIFIQEAVSQLKAKNLEPSELTLPTTGPNQLDIRMSGMSYYLKTDVGGDARLQIGSFLAVKEKLERDRVVPAEYIDVRVEEKVFYK